MKHVQEITLCAKNICGLTKSALWWTYTGTCNNNSVHFSFVYVSNRKRNDQLQNQHTYSNNTYNNTKMIIITTPGDRTPWVTVLIGYPWSSQASNRIIPCIVPPKPPASTSFPNHYLLALQSSPQADPCYILCPPVTVNHPWHITLLNVQSETPKVTIMPVNLHRTQRHASRCAFNTSQLFPLLIISGLREHTTTTGKGVTPQLKWCAIVCFWRHKCTGCLLLQCWGRRWTWQYYYYYYYYY